MAVLETNYVRAGSIPTAVDGAQASPQALSAGSQAAMQEYQNLGNKFEHMTSGLNYMYGEQQKADLRDQFRQQKMDDRNEAIANHMQDAQNKIYVAQSSISAQYDLNNALHAASKNIQPGGQIGDDVMKQYSQIAQSYVENAPNDQAKALMQQKLSAAVPKIQQWGFKAQASVDQNNAIQTIQSLAQTQAQAAYNDPTQVDTLSSQLHAYGQALKNSGISSPHVDANIDSAILAVHKNSLFSIADQDPTQAQKLLAAGVYNDILVKDPQFQTQLLKRIDNAQTKDIKAAETGLSLIPNSIIGGMQPPTNAMELLNKANDIVNKYQDRYPAVAQQLINKQQVATNLMDVQKSLTGTTPDQLNQIKLGLYATEKNLPGDPVTLETTKLTKQLIDNRQKLFHHSPMDVEQADGTMKAPTVALSPNLNNDPEALKTFINERTNIQDILGAKNYRTKDGAPNTSPLTNAELSDFTDKISNLDPVAKLNALQFTNNMPASLANPILQRVAGKNGDGASTAAIKLNAYDPQLAQSIVEGQAAMSGDNKLISRLPTKDVMQSVGQTFAGMFQNDPAQVKQWMSAAQALTAKNALATGTAATDSDLTDNLKKVAGIDQVKQDTGIFGTKYNTIMPYVPVTEAAKPGDPTNRPLFRRMTGDEFTAKVNSIKDPATLAQYGNGTPVDGLNGKTIDLAKTPLSIFKWTPTADGMYSLKIASKTGDRPLINNENGLPYQFNMKQYLKDSTGQDHG